MAKLKHPITGTARDAGLKLFWPMEKLRKYILILVSIFCFLTGFAQPPAITYGNYKSFTVNDSIPSLPPLNTGGAVPEKIYGKVTTYFKKGLHNPMGVAADEDGNIYIADEANNCIKKVLPDGKEYILASGFNGPSALAVDGKGNVFVADCFNHKIKKVLPGGGIITLAGTGTAGDSDNRTGTKAQISYPVGLALGSDGTLYFSDEGNNKIKKITPEGAVSTLAGNGTAGAADNLNGSLASFNQPQGIAVDAAGTIFVADQRNHKIRRITPEGQVSTYAGTGLAGALNHPIGVFASFNNPRGLAIDARGVLYVADAGNQQIRKIEPGSSVSLLAGNGIAGAGDDKDDEDDTNASFNFPNSLAINREGEIYVADCLNNSIRCVQSTGYAIVPGILPPGIKFDRTTGTFSGKAAAFFKEDTYTITAYNTSGSASTILRIGVSMQPGNALNFDGLDDQVNIPDKPELNGDKMSIELWVNMHTLAPKPFRFILKRNALLRYDDSYAVGIDSTGHFNAIMASGTGKKDSQVIATDEAPAQLNRWYYLAAVFAKDSLKLYVNGKLVSKVFSGFPLSKGPNALTMNFDRLISFSMDEVRIFNEDRSEQIPADMYRTLLPATPGLVAYYNFNSGIPGGFNQANLKLYDLTFYGNDGTLQNFTSMNGSTSNWIESYAMVVPVAKDNLTEHITPTGFTARWLAPPLGHADYYSLEVAEDPQFRNFVEGYKSKRISGTTEVIDNLRPGTFYYYRVRANKQSLDGQGAYSATVKVKTN